MTIPQITDRYIFNTYPRYPLVIKKAKGSWVWDDKGKKYLDFFSGLAVSGIGHGLPSVVSAIKKQADTLIHSSNYYYTEPAAKLAEQLCKRSFAGKVFFSNSGTEANECAIKLARRHGAPQNRYEIVVFEHGFHGRTMGSLSATPQPRFHQGFGPMLPGFPMAQLNNLASVEKVLSARTAAILIEPVQGEGGINPATVDFLKGLRSIADRQGLLLMFDSVQCSMGRTGDLFSYQTFGVEPDVMTLAKGLGGGLPIGATLVREEFGTLLGRGDHGSTFGGNPVCCAAALAVLKQMTPALLKKVKAQSQSLRQTLHDFFGKNPHVREIRALGYLIGMQLDTPGMPYVEACRDKGLLINCTQNTVLRFLPPLAISPADIRFALNVLSAVLR